MAYNQGVIICILCATCLVCHGHSVYKQRQVTEAREPEQVMNRMAPVIPTVVMSCSSQYTKAISDYLVVLDTIKNLPVVSVANTVNEMIRTLCGSHYYYGLRFISCVQIDLPQSLFFIDQVLMSAINTSSLPNILYGGCNITDELDDKMTCIITGVKSNPSTMKCLTDIETFLHHISNQTTYLDATVQEFCRVWGRMVMCITPYIGMCNAQLGHLWAFYGKEILTHQCQQYAFPTEGSKGPAENGVVHDILGVFHTKNSATSFCANERNKNLIPYLPTSIMDPARLSNNTVWDLLTTCGSPLQEFMLCMDERRLNSSSAVDNFLFKVISTVNMRIAYNRMCSQKEVLKNNVNCLINSPLDLQTCMCHMTDLMHMVMEMSAQPQGFTYGQSVDPFCSYYVSFVDCYVGLLGTCSHDLGLLMQNVYLGALTDTCLNTSMAPCGSEMPEQIGQVSPPVFLQCGTKVARFVNVETMGTNVTAAVEDMMTDMEELIVEAYNYTCSIGEEILNCLGEKFTTSLNQFDKLLVQMFDTSKFEFILQEGCNPALLNDIKFRLQYILSMILSDPRLSSCIEALNSFKDVLNGKVDVGVPNTMDPYCRTWADFSECIESKLSCSNPELAKKWRQFTMESLNMGCQIIAMHQQEINPIGTTCDINSMSDSALSLCGMSFMAYYMAQSSELPERPVHEAVMDGIHYFCKNAMDEAIIMKDCLRSTIPSSSMTIDMMADRIFDLSAIDGLPTNICGLSEDIEKRMSCITDSMEAWADTENCLSYLENGFDVTTFQNKSMDDLVNQGCRGWEDFIHCILPHINVCDINLSSIWSNLTYTVLTDKCQSYSAKMATQTDKNGNSGGLAASDNGLIFFCLAFLFTLSHIQQTCSRRH